MTLKVAPMCAKAHIIRNSDYWRWKIRLRFMTNFCFYFQRNIEIFTHRTFLRFYVYLIIVEQSPFDRSTLFLMISWEVEKFSLECQIFSLISLMNTRKIEVFEVSLSSVIIIFLFYWLLFIIKSEFFFQSFFFRASIYLCWQHQFFFFFKNVLLHHSIYNGIVDKST